MQYSWTNWLSQLRCGLGNIIEITEIVAQSAGTARFRHLQRYALVLITRGEGIYEDEAGRYRSIGPGDWMLVLPDLGHGYWPLGNEGWDVVYAMFEGQAFDQWRSMGLLSENHVTGHVADTDALIIRLREKVVDSRAGAVERFCEFQSLLAGVLEGESDNESRPSQKTSWFADACRLLCRPEAEVRAVAEELGISYETFRRQFKELSGMPPHRYHRVHLIHNASRLLDTTDMKVADISRTLGFCDEAYFSRTFKQVTGKSPREHRLRMEPGME